MAENEGGSSRHFRGPAQDRVVRRIGLDAAAPPQRHKGRRQVVHVAELGRRSRGAVINLAVEDQSHAHAITHEGDGRRAAIALASVPISPSAIMLASFAMEHECRAPAGMTEARECLRTGRPGSTRWCRLESAYPLHRNADPRHLAGVIFARLSSVRISAATACPNRSGSAFVMWRSATCGG